MAPAALAIPDDVREFIRDHGQLNTESEHLTPELVAKTDVLYCTRVAERALSQSGRLRATEGYPGRGQRDPTARQGAHGDHAPAATKPRNSGGS